MHAKNGKRSGPRGATALTGTSGPISRRCAFHIKKENWKKTVALFCGSRAGVGRGLKKPTSGATAA